MTVRCPYLFPGSARDSRNALGEGSKFSASRRKRHARRLRRIIRGARATLDYFGSSEELLRIVHNDGRNRYGI